MNVIKANYEIEQIDGVELLKKIEKIGRVCYKSEDKITNDSCFNFVKMLIKHGHEAMIEHGVITVKLTCDRGVSHEGVRHRIASFAQSSTRYCNYSDDKYGNQITFIDIRGSIDLDTKMKDLPLEAVEAIIQEWYDACIDSERHYLRMIELGATPQIARSVLNNSLMTELVITMNCRSWRNFFKLRSPLTAHPAMRELAVPMLGDFKYMIPVMFDDIEVIE